MVDSTRYGGTGGEDFPGARKPLEEMTPGGMGTRTTAGLLYGDPEDPPASTNPEPGAVDWSDAVLPQVQDILDETTTLTSEGLWILSGENLVNHMSPIAPWCLDTEQMNIVTEDGTDWGTGWTFKVLNGHEGASAAQDGAITLAKLSVNSIYVDPDQDILTSIDGLAQWMHCGVRDPTIQGAVYAGDSYGNAVYNSPVYEYADEEELKLHKKFGYTVSGDWPADTYSAVMARIDMEIDDLIEMLQVGYSSRQNISRSTPGINIFDNFEVISAVENEEPIDESMSGVATSTMNTDTGDYDS
tara:strand:+ start:3821 stop:4720 length:900 start_codon:yes stop_codon:yes gene_type:complete